MLINNVKQVKIIHHTFGKPFKDLYASIAKNISLDFSDLDVSSLTWANTLSSLDTSVSFPYESWFSRHLPSISEENNQIKVDTSSRYKGLVKYYDQIEGVDKAVKNPLYLNYPAVSQQANSYLFNTILNMAFLYART